MATAVIRPRERNTRRREMTRRGVIEGSGRRRVSAPLRSRFGLGGGGIGIVPAFGAGGAEREALEVVVAVGAVAVRGAAGAFEGAAADRKSTRLNSSHIPLS